MGSNPSVDRLDEHNLVCVFKSEAVDVQTKRRHTDWLNSRVDESFSEATPNRKRRLKEFVQDGKFEIIRAVVDSRGRKEPPGRGVSAKTRLPSPLDHFFSSSSFSFLLSKAIHRREGK